MTQNDLYALIESASTGSSEDMRTVLQALVDQVSLHNVASGNQWLQSAGTGAGAVAAPPAGTLTVIGGNGNVVLSIANPKLNYQATLYHEISYSETKNFSQGVTTLPPTAATTLTLAMPGASPYLRIRTSVDQKTWSPYVTQTQPVSAGLLSSAATEDGATFNQTNFGVVDSVAVGSTANVRVNGTGGLLTNLVALKGSTQRVLPSATIINVAPATDQFVAYDGNQYHVQNTLAGVLKDGWTPIGKVSVVGTGVPSLPSISPVEYNGYIIGYTVTNQGNGLGGPVSTTVNGSGNGATTGAQTIQNGKLISVAPGNLGDGTYTSSGNSVTVTGGTNMGSAGGGTTVGGNGGRMTAV